MLFTQQEKIHKNCLKKNSTVFTCPLKILLKIAKKPSRCGEIVAKFPPPPFAYTTRIKTIQNYKKNLSVKILLCESLSYCSCCSLQLHLYECLNKVKKAEKHIDLMGIMINLLENPLLIHSPDLARA